MKQDILEGLSKSQIEAVEAINGPTLIIAGAGSGKTRVLTTRIANLIKNGVNPGRIMALSFTKKAAGEMKERVAQLVGEKSARYIWMGTFHSIFIRFLRANAELLGYPTQFTIYDKHDSNTAIKQCVKELNLDEKIYKPGDIASRISKAKNNLVTAAAYMASNALQEEDRSAKKGRICDVYVSYANKCKASGCMDFDDILLNMNILLRDHLDVLKTIQEQFDYILVDEYQDTNYAQYLILKKISAVKRNICVVGDDCQSIYGFRGARIENILTFQKDYPDAAIFKLEQNYRSTENIVNAANSLISKNENRLNKHCFSSSGPGEKISIINAFTEAEESILVASSIADRIYSTKASYDQFAILYRTNSQSRAMEEALRKRNFPYRIHAGFSFYDRAEVKDLMAYFRLIINPLDNEAFKRVVNFPTRGIGTTTINHLSAIATAEKISMLDAVLLDDQKLISYNLKKAAILKLRDFAVKIFEFHEKALTISADKLAEEIGKQFGIFEAMRADQSIEGITKYENIEELYNSIKDFCEEQVNQRVEMGEGSIDDIIVTLSEYLENITLLSAVEREEDSNDDDSDNKITLMTIHASKGLEFPYVYIIGMEENLFPSASDLTPRGIEEERRLFYVALTRAMKAVCLSHADNRMRWGKSESNAISRFVTEIDSKYIDGIVPISRERIGMPSEDLKKAFIKTPNYSRQDIGYKYSNQQQKSFVRPQSPSPRVSPAPSANFVQSAISDLKVGQLVEHDRFGFGTIIQFDGVGSEKKAIVDFKTSGRKTLLLKYAKLRIAD